MASELLKYIAMIPMVSATTIAEGTTMTSPWNCRYGDIRTASRSVQSIANSDLAANLKRQILLNAIRSFEEDLGRVKDTIVGNEAQARIAFSKAAVEIGSLNPTNVIVGLTDSNSIYFRIYNTGGYETHFELFYINEDNDGVDAVATIYKNEEVVLKAFGSMENVMAKIRNTFSPPQQLAPVKEYVVSI